ncbi:MAG TPA: AAA family ATPase, partial [Thermomicrobiaceae bacterium]|nr:AAA family ATPase [Thermomicrobiaceae bacterium]
SATAFASTADELARIGSQEALFAAAADFLRAIAAQRPLLLVLDDLQWADQASLDSCRMLARQLGNQRILLVATYRSDEVTRRHPLATLLPLLVREAGAERLDVQPLQEAGNRALIQSRYELADIDQGRLERYLEAHAEGNPLYAGELLRTLEDEGVLARQAGSWTLGDLEQVRVPALLRQVIERRVARLDEESQRLLAVAAVIGQVVPLGVWATVGEVDEDTLLGMAERAEEANLLRGLPAGDGVRFSHALIREALYDGIPSLRRRRLHLRVGEALIATANPAPDMVAYHLERAGDPRAVDWLIRAGERARDLYAPDAVIAHLISAERLAKQRARSVPVTAYLMRGQAQRLVGNFEPAREDLETVLTLARQAGDGRVEWQALNELGMLWMARDYARTGEYLQQALALARSLDAPDLTGHSLSRVGNWYVNVERPLEGLQHHREALAIFEQLDDRTGIAASLDLLALASFLSGDLIQGNGYLRRAVELFRASGDREGLASCLAQITMQGVNYLTDSAVIAQVTMAERLRAGEEAFAIAHAISWRAGESYALCTRACCLGAGGASGAALDAARRSIEIAEEIDHSQWLSAAHSATGAIYFDLLALSQAQQHLEQAFSFARPNASTAWIHLGSSFLASVLLAGGDRARAEAVLAAVLNPETPMQTLAQRRLWAARVELVLAHGDPEAALGLLDRLVAATPNASPKQPVLRYEFSRAQALAALGQYEAAQAALLAIQGVAQALEARPWSWRIHLERGKLCAQQERQEQAVAEFAAARAIIDELAAETPDDLRPAFLDQTARLFPAAP